MNLLEIQTNMIQRLNIQLYLAWPDSTKFSLKVIYTQGVIDLQTLSHNPFIVYTIDNEFRGLTVIIIRS